MSNTAPIIKRIQELELHIDRINRLLTLLIQKSHPSILADMEQEPPDKCVPDEVLRAEDRIDRFLAEVARHEDVDRSRLQSAPDYSRARRWLEQTQREGNIGFLYDWLPRMLTEFAAVEAVPDTPAQPEKGNGCSSSQLLPCGCRFNYCATDRTGPVFWNQFNGVVQCHMCGQTYTPAAPRVPQGEEKQP